MLSSVEQAFVGRDEKRSPLKTPAWEATETPDTQAKKNLKHFAGSRIIRKNAGSRERRAELRRSTRKLQSIIKVSSWRL